MARRRIFIDRLHAERQRSIRNQKARPTKRPGAKRPADAFRIAGNEFHEALDEIGTVEAVIRRAVAAGVFSDNEVAIWTRRIDEAPTEAARDLIAFRLGQILTRRLRKKTEQRNQDESR